MHKREVKMKYRFDDTYQKVFEYSAEHSAYIYVSTYTQSGIGSRWSEERKVRKMEKNFMEWHFGKVDEEEQ